MRKRKQVYDVKIASLYETCRPVNDRRQTFDKMLEW